MLGAIIGDIIGSIYEFNNTRDYHFPLFSERSSFTDDTICTVAVADALLTGEDFGTSLHRWCNGYPNPMGGYGGSFALWLRSKNPQPYNSFGNGAAMRVSPCAWAFLSRYETIEAAASSARCTHDHTEGIIGATTVAEAIFLIRFSKERTTERDILHDLVVNAYGEAWNEHLPLPGVFDETCQGCVPLAFHICGLSNSFEDAIRKAVSYGGDSDTLAAIVGALAEARWGIPVEIRNEAMVRLDNRIISVIERFKKKFNYGKE
ncbi:MAG: ADP-ribosylglycohydrolase family protein [Bacteroides sp.]|nr:ADP-ribosylglycohydrolase family protein [Bacteroides sp.]